ncbi:hypothetical protein [Cupriavidus pauculus]|uniref:hypothetical protein n=1 Tax=Cupriavidus pauculus TaxID=82633 RepID=UPI000782E540|nr:hypothetical protein [Cupriavidus pauculus]
MVTLDWPADLVPSKATWGIQSNTESFTSPLNRSTQTVERPGARWKALLEFPPKQGDALARLEAFLASLGGQAGRFYLWPHHRPGSSALAPVVAGTLLNLKVLPVATIPPNTLAFRAGDFIEAGGELKMVIADATSDVTGGALVQVSPPFRKQPTVGSPIRVNKPRATMMLASDEYAVAVMPGRVSDSVVISAVEVF